MPVLLPCSKLLRGLVPVLLGATAFNDSAKGGAGAVLEGCRDEEVAALFVDPTASHLVEALLQVRVFGVLVWDVCLGVCVCV